MTIGQSVIFRNLKLEIVPPPVRTDTFRNGNFKEFDASGVPTGWANESKSFTELLPVPGGGIAVKLTGTAPNHSILSQSIFGLKPAEKLQLSGNIKAPHKGMGYLMVKLYAGGREIFRKGSDASGTGAVAIVFDCGQADKMEILCRVKPDENWIGESVIFQDLKLEPATATSPRSRENLVKAVNPGELLLRPTFNSCGFYFGAPELKNPLLQFRKTGTVEWQSALSPVYFKEFRNYRGSIVKLDENTRYEVRFVSDGKTHCSGSFQTWQSDVPVARTIVLDKRNFTAPLKISEQGTPEGWIRYTAAPGFVLENDTESPAIILDRAKFVLLDDLTVRGGNTPRSIVMSQSDNIRIRNCDISGWGRIGIQRFDNKGTFYEEKSTTDYGCDYIDYNAAIVVGRSCTGIVVERCYIHDPRNRANSWYYSHPHGPEAILLDIPDHSTVIRYNDFIGSDLHRWNDAVEGMANFEPDGGFNRDADIYGNFMIFANDDDIELDGGQQNVRCFWNRFESALCGVSIQGCMVSPVYVFENLFAGMGEEFGAAGQTVKTGGGGQDAVAFLFNNTFWGGGYGIAMVKELKCIFKNNLMSDNQGVGNPLLSPQSVFENNTIENRITPLGTGLCKGKFDFISAETGDFTPAKSDLALEIANFCDAGKQRGAIQQGEMDSKLPYRPIPVLLDRSRIQAVMVQNNKVTPTSVQITATVGEKNFQSEYVVRQNNVFDWFEVTPASGVIKSGDKVTFTVKFKPEKMRFRRNYRGAFLIRMKNGLSRPVSIYAKTDFVPPLEVHKDGETAIYLDPFKIENGVMPDILDDPAGMNGKCVILDAAKNGNKVLEYKFSIPRDGRYYFMIHGYGVPQPVFEIAVNSDGFAPSRQQSSDYMYWTILAPGAKFGNMLRHYDLKAGVHSLKIKIQKGTFRFDRLLATDAPGSFEPR